jgi:hypothetical protein
MTSVVLATAGTPPVQLPAVLQLLSVAPVHVKVAAMARLLSSASATSTRR